MVSIDRKKFYILCEQGPRKTDQHLLCVSWVTKKTPTHPSTLSTTFAFELGEVTELIRQHGNRTLVSEAALVTVG